MTAAWKLRGEYAESCSCDYLCPCIYTNPQGPATGDQCTALMAYRIDEGRYGDIALDGLAFAFVIRSGRVMADGNWIFACVVDERADARQREALGAIVSGRAGGTPAVLHDNLVGDFRGIRFAPIDFRMDGLSRSVAVADLIAFAIAGVESRSAAGEPICIDNTSHPANRRLALARATAAHLHGFGLDLDLVGKGNNGHFAPFAWTAPEPAGATRR
ncbi:MAG: DUF1326 domain-containing protein [Rhodospirillales bacterium]|nr:DUF1326 domain-containing protein [Rhodospirillales bacterium]